MAINERRVMTSPIPGWYTDPADASQHRYWDGDMWTDKTRPSGGTATLAAPTVLGALPAAEKRSGWRTGGVIAVVVVGVVALIGLGLALRPSGGSSGSTPIVGASSTVGWEPFASRSAAITYLANPDWTDFYTENDERAMVDAMGDVQGAAVEVAGLWLLDGSLVTGGTTLMVIAVDEGSSVGSPQIQTQAFLMAAKSGVDDFEEVASEGMTTSAGDDAWRVDFTGASMGLPFTSTVIAIEHGDVDVIVYGVSPGDFDEWLGDALALANTLVVAQAPTTL
jgi:hypothetical protein